MKEKDAVSSGERTLCLSGKEDAVQEDAVPVWQRKRCFGRQKDAV